MDMDLEHADPRGLLAQADSLRQRAAAIEAVLAAVSTNSDATWTLHWNGRSVAVPPFLLVRWLTLTASIVTDLTFQANDLEAWVRVVPPEDVPF